MGRRYWSQEQKKLRLFQTWRSKQEAVAEDWIQRSWSKDLEERKEDNREGGERQGWNKSENSDWSWVLGHSCRETVLGSSGISCPRLQEGPALPDTHRHAGGLVLVLRGWWVSCRSRFPLWAWRLSLCTCLFILDCLWEKILPKYFPTIHCMPLFFPFIGVRGLDTSALVWLLQ